MLEPTRHVLNLHRPPVDFAFGHGAHHMRTSLGGAARPTPIHTQGTQMLHALGAASEPARGRRELTPLTPSSTVCVYPMTLSNNYTYCSIGSIPFEVIA